MTIIPAHFSDAFVRDSEVRDPFGLSGRNIEDAAFYNFDYYQVFSVAPAASDHEDPSAEVPSEPGTEPEPEELEGNDLLQVPGARELLEELDPLLDQAKVDLLNALFQFYVGEAVDHWDECPDVNFVEDPSGSSFNKLKPLPREVYQRIFAHDFIFHCLPVHYEVLVALQGRIGWFTLTTGESVYLDYPSFITKVISAIPNNKEPKGFGLFGGGTTVNFGGDYVYPNEILHRVEIRQDPNDPFSPKIKIVLPLWQGTRRTLLTGIWRAAEHGLREDAPTSAPTSTDPPTSTSPSVPAAAEVEQLQTAQLDFGLRITYRQHWQHVGNQFSPPLRTIPLGPGQSEKISVKLTRREKLTSTRERSESKETLTETSSSTKDSTQIVEEAAKSNQWKIDQKMQGGFDCGLWNLGGSTDISLGEEFKTSSKEAKESIAESMAKASTKIRNETKVSVSREQEITFESQQSAEIKNPNDEVAVTYLYQLLQKQYMITTYLAELSPVVLIPHPLLSAFTYAWVREHGRVLDNVLLDETFRDALTAIRTDPSIEPSTAQHSDHDPGYAAIEGAVKNMGAAVANIAGSTASFGSNFDGMFSVFGTMAEQRTRQRGARQRLEFLAKEFLNHLATNALYYMQAIWAAEDSETRALRLEKLMIPSRVRFVAESATAEALEGYWEFDVDTPMIKVADIVDHTGPVAFRGNCAVYLLRATAALAGLAPLFAYHRLPFSRPPRIVAPSPGLEVRILAPFLVAAGNYIIEAGKATLTISWIDALGNRKPVTSAEHNRNTEVITTNGVFAITVRNMLPGIGRIGEFHVTPPQLADPELLEIERNNPLPTPGSDEERKLFSAAVVADMFWALPGLRSLVGELLGLEDAAQDWRTTGVPWDLVPAEARPILRDYYHEYLLRKQNQRFVVVDTNSVVLNLFTGTESALETFKRAHRYLDVLKAEVDLERRKALLSKGILDDPEVETMVRVNGMESVLPTP